MKQHVSVKRGDRNGALLVYFRASTRKAAHRAIECLEADPMDGYRLHVSKVTRQSKRGGKGQRVQLVLHPLAENTPELDLALVKSEIEEREGKIALGEGDA